MKIIIQILFLLFVGFAMNAQGADPHGSAESAITGMVSTEIKNHKNLDKMGSQKQLTTSEKVYAKDEAEIKATIEQFLIVAGNYQLDKMEKMMADNASLATKRLRDGKWTTETMLMRGRIMLASLTTSYPATRAHPEEGPNRVVRILIRVVFPAPFGPSSPKSSPLLTCRLMSLRAPSSLGSVFFPPRIW